MPLRTWERPPWQNGARRPNSKDLTSEGSWVQRVNNWDGRLRVYPLMTSLWRTRLLYWRLVYLQLHAPNRRLSYKEITRSIDRTVLVRFNSQVHYRNWETKSCGGVFQIDFTKFAILGIYQIREKVVHHWFWTASAKGSYFLFPLFVYFCFV